MGWAEAASGVGLVVGPVLGSILYGSVGYMYTFVIFGAILALSSLLTYFILPNPSASSNDDLEESNESLSKLEKPVTYSMFFTNLRCLMSLLACTVIMMLCNFLDSILSVELSKTY